jgi:DNA invertase Pin-like site-specific DNA recombinase
MASEPLRGKRYINLLRCSTVMQDTSIADQKRVNDHFASQHGMTFVRDVILEGVSGSKTFNRRDLKQLLDDRKQYKNYDVIVVYDSSRLTRGGSGHGSAIRRDFAKVAVLILSIMDPVPEGDFRDVMQSLIDTNNHIYSRKLSGFVTRGLVQGLLRRDYEHIGGLPIGIDRVYLRADGTPHLRLRNVGHGVRHLIDEQTQQVSRVYDPTVDRNVSYLKQRDEKVRLVLGEDRVTAAIREAFALRYKHNWGYTRISRHLSRNGIKPMRGRYWRASVVRGFLLNPMYLGWSYSLKVASGLFHKGDVNSPQDRKIDQTIYEDDGRETLPRENRPKSEMVRIEHQHLEAFITDLIVREKAEAAINEFFDEFHLKKEHVLCNFKLHPTSKYFLSGLMRDKQYGRVLIGTTTGRKKRPNRYYKVSNINEFTDAGTTGRAGVPADPLEKTVLAVLRGLFGDTQRVSRMIQRHVETLLDSSAGPPKAGCGRRRTSGEARWHLRDRDGQEVAGTQTADRPVAGSAL